MDKRDSTYDRWTKDALIRRIQKLEANLLRAGEHKSEEAQDSITSTAIEEGATSPPKKKKVERKIDPSKYSTRLVAFKLAYLGKRYGGFEYAASANLPSIEEELWKAFVKACLIFPENSDEVNWDPWEYSKCGRTDRGVSAFGQVIVVRVRSNRPLPKKEQQTEAGQVDENGEAAKLDAAAEDTKKKREFNDFTDELPYCRLLNKLLPPDIRMLAWCPTTPADFSARHDCRERQYRYFFTQPAFAPIPQSFENPDNSKKVKGGWLDIEAMRQAAKKFEGLHDFRNFCRVDQSKININFERRVFESDIVEVKDVETALPFLDREEFRPSGMDLQEKLPKVYYFHVRGTAFLWHQIRCMVAIIFMVGQGLEDPSIVDKLLDFEAEPRRPNYQLADEVPLVLWDCIFPRPEKPENALKWVYVGEENPLSQHGTGGLLNSTWEYWRERKMDELLAGQLLNIISSQADISLRKDPKAPLHIPPTTRTFEGGDRERLVGKYQPLLQKPRLPSPAEVFDREARRKGFADAAEMREAWSKRREEATDNLPPKELPLEEGTE
ncbi:tRNA pseudouridine(38/39) synthase [Daldinia childiae]|uniref:tRNA pseudouridine(38/39) synthase n=1 Tax=Daldinia childiae TaxID=326645 RepID=UPI00144839ED|nr:tRNA pseudouridine(38/39) synthase [Daldinia childiae]KAF3071180.1 tRNA pseudouridine(38/39) synthase [Daldinia childiae]